jgi:hypothetical protein
VKNLETNTNAKGEKFVKNEKRKRKKFFLPENETVEIEKVIDDKLRLGREWQIEWQQKRIQRRWRSQRDDGDTHQPVHDSSGQRVAPG